jgi:hypothetical protein
MRFARRTPWPTRALFLLGSVLLPSETLAEMPEGDAWNVGSVFAAATQCEARGYMPQGQATPLMVRAIQRIPVTDSQRLRDGYQEGLKRTAIYSKNYGRWASYPLTSEGCSQVQYAINQYKIAFDLIDQPKPQDSTVGLTGVERSSFVEGATNNCLREQQRNPLPLSPSAISQYCKCYANGVADRLSVNQIKAQEAMGPTEQAAAMRPLIEAAARPCTTAALNSR